MNTEALNQLVRVLNQVQNTAELLASFSLSDWMDTNDIKAERAEDILKETPHTMEYITIPHKCGATACAVGYAGLDPWFRARGFETSIYGDLQYTYTLQEGGTQSEYNWAAPMKFFDLAEHEAHYLFFDANYRDQAVDGKVEPLVVANRIKEFIRIGGVPEGVTVYGLYHEFDEPTLD